MTWASLALLLGLAGFPCTGLAQAGETAEATDSARLQGTWTMVSASAGGTPLPATDVQSMKRVNAGNQVTITRAGQLFFKATITLNPGVLPKTIDYHMTEGVTAGAVQLGIYALKADTVRFSFGAPGAPRPGDFTTAPGDGRTVSTWVRSR